MKKLPELVLRFILIIFGIALIWAGINFFVIGLLSCIGFLTCVTIKGIIEGVFLIMFGVALFCLGIFTTIRN